MTMTSGRSPSSQIVEVKGGGLALIDYDRDGDLDVFIPNGATMDAPEAGPGAKLFQNQGDLAFRDVTDEARIDHHRWSMGVAVADYDGNGFDDIYITCYGRNTLLRNNGDDTFSDMTERAGVGDERWSTACTFGDIDGDGDLDLYVANYVEFDIDRPPPPSAHKGVPVFAGPRGLPAQADALYENLGDGTFRDITAPSGCAAVAPSYGLGTIILDFTGDGRPDIFVGNDSMANFLFRNLGERRFQDVGRRSGLATNLDGSEQATMGIGVADVNGDGYPDLFTTNFANDTNTLHVSDGDGEFWTDRTAQYGFGMHSRPYLGWACGFYDFEHDGDEDLMVFNGHVYPHATRATMDSDRLQTPLLYRREGERFDRIESASEVGAWLEELHSDRSAAFGDLDDDGDIDIVVAELNGPVRVLRNDGARGDWLIVALRDERPGAANTNALGARVELTPRTGPKQTRWIYSGGSFVSASAMEAHFGIPDGAGELTLAIIWPDGERQRIENVSPRQRLVVKRGE